MTEAAATELFLTRARWLRPGLQLTGAEAESAREIVRLVDGMPLAIELAAARMRVMSTTQIVQQMRSRFSLLTGGRNARQETLSAVIDASWELLDPWEQSAWLQCAAFESGFDLDAAEAVLDLTAWPEAPWVVEVVQSLVDKSILRTWVPAVRVGETESQLRFGMYVSLQDYARRMLREGPSRTRAERETGERHGRWYARHGTDEMLQALDRHGGVQRRQHMELEIDNLMSACRLALDRGDHPTAVAAYRAAWAALELLGPFTRAISIGHQILSDRQLNPAERAITLRTLALAERHSDRSDDGHRHLEEAIAIHRELGDRRGEAIARGLLGGLLQTQGQTAAARAHYMAALETLQITGDRGFEGNILSNFGSLCASRGHMEEAKRLLEEALLIHRELGNRRFEGVTLTTLGQLHGGQGRIAEWSACEEAALAIHREVGNRRFECNALSSLGGMFMQLGDLNAATVHFERALQISREIGSLRLEARILGDLALVLHSQGRLDEAGHRFQEALAIHRHTGNRPLEAAIVSRWAELQHSRGLVNEVPEGLLRAEQTFRSMDDQESLGTVLCIRAKFEHAIQNTRAARTALAEAEALAARVGCGPNSRLLHMIDETRDYLARAVTRPDRMPEPNGSDS